MAVDVYQRSDYSPASTVSPRTATRRSFEEVAARCWRLRHNQSGTINDRRRVRDICNGGPAGLAALLGDLPTTSTSVPAANLILSGIDRLAQRLGQAPSVRVDIPLGDDSERSRRSAERRERIVAGYDGPPHPLELQLPQAARWLPGYGFFGWVIRESFDADGYRCPIAELRDPLDTYPGAWGPDQQPAEVMFLRRVPRETLARIYPGRRAAIYAGSPSLLRRGYVPPPVSASRIQAASTGQVSGQWEGATDDDSTVEVAEYYDGWGCYLLLYEGTGLEAYPSPLRSGPPFVMVKRFSFDRLQGQFDQVVGLLASMARLNILSEIAMRDAVFAETVVTGRLDAPYMKGRNAVNVIEGGDVKKVVSNLPYQMFQEIDRIERQFRTTSGYSAQSDGESPTSFATGKGLGELASGADAAIRELQVALRHGLQARDAKLLEWDDLAYPDQTRTISGEMRGAAYTETYTPSRHIKGNYRTRRAYGAMAGFDDYQKIVAGLQLLGARVISRLTMQENISGLENLMRENERIRGEQAEETLFGMMAAAASGQPIDPRVPLTLVEMLPPSALREQLKIFWTPDDPQPTPEQMAALAPPAPEPTGPALPPQPPGDITTALSLMRANGSTGGGVQTAAPL